MKIQAVHAHWGYHYKIPITTKFPTLGHPHVYRPLGPLPPPAGATTMCGTIPNFFFFLAFLPPFLYAHTLSVSTDRIRTPRLHYKTEVKTAPPLFSHNLFVICSHPSCFSSATNYMLLILVHNAGTHSLHGTKLSLSVQLFSLRATRYLGPGFRPIKIILLLVLVILFASY